eukprot:scaffold193724_cov18-Prasinocladus_malaysianus.AAC.1
MNVCRISRFMWDKVHCLMTYIGTRSKSLKRSTYVVSELLWPDWAIPGCKLIHVFWSAAAAMV